MRERLPTQFVRLLSLLAAAACGGADLVLPGEAGPAQIVIARGDGQTASVGSALADSIVVRVTDAQDRAVAGLAIAFAPTGASSGDVVPDTSLTGADGRAGTRWVLGSAAGPQTVDAKVAGFGALSVRFTASALPTTAAAITPFAGDGQSAAVGTALPDSLVVLITDQFGNPVQGVGLQWSVVSGSVSPATALSGADGRAGARRVLGSTAGQQTAIATAAGLDGSPVTFTHQAVPGTAASLVLISGSGQTAPPGTTLPEPLVVRLVDADGNGIPSRAVSWVIATGGGTPSPPTSNTDSDGFASTAWTLGSADGPNVLNAVVSDLVGGVVEFLAMATTGPSASLSTVTAAPGSIPAITGISTITVTVRDVSGSPLQGATVTLAASGEGNLLTQPSGVTGSDGVATGSLSSTVQGIKDVTATVNGSVILQQIAQISVTPPLADHLVFRVEPSDVLKNQVMNPPVEVAVVDALGAIVPESGIEILIELRRSGDRGSGSRLQGDRTQPTVNGVAVFSGLSINNDENDYRFRASAPDRPELGTVESNTFDVQ